jgi:hypothetical protein
MARPSGIQATVIPFPVDVLPPFASDIAGCSEPKLHSIMLQLTIIWSFCLSLRRLETISVVIIIDEAKGTS